MQAFPGLSLVRASILDFRPRLANRCKFFPSFGPGAAVILDFRPRLGNRCRVEWFRLQLSLLQRGIARLQHRCEAQAGTGCHGGGIILSKKPPEWHLSLPLPVAGSWCSLLPLPVAGFWCSLPLLPRGFTTGSHEGDAVKAFKVSTFLLFLRYNRRFAE